MTRVVYIAAAAAAFWLQCTAAPASIEILVATALEAAALWGAFKPWIEKN